MNPTAASVLAGTLHGFFTDYLPRQRAMSPHTLHSYRDSLKLLLRFVAGMKHDPSTLTVERLTVNQILAFLEHLESGRRNKACTRNVRLTAIHSFFRYLGGLHPEHLEQAQRVLSIPFKRVAIREIQHLDLAEIEAVLKSIDRSTRDGRRDRVLISLMFNTGARVSEIVGLKASDLRLLPPPSVLLQGKGRKERVCPLWPETANLIRKHLEELGIHPDRPETIFRNHWGRALTRFGVRLILRKHVGEAASNLPSLKKKAPAPSQPSPQHRPIFATCRQRPEHHCPLARPRQHQYHQQVSGFRFGSKTRGLVENQATRATKGQSRSLAP